MDETPITHPGVPEEVYHTLGKKTFWIFFLQRVHAAFILLLLTIALFVIERPTVLDDQAVRRICTRYVMMAAWICALLFIVVLAITFFICWLIYRDYKFCLGDDSLKIKRGIFE